MLLMVLVSKYGFRASDERFLEEWLYAWPLERNSVVERDCDSVASSEKFEE